MIHQMGLYKEFFTPIKDGKKIIEVRLNDEKRQNIQVGDYIEFTKVPEQDEVLRVKVEKLQVFETFRAMYEAIPFVDFDCSGWTMEDMVAGTYEIYTPEQENKWGTLAIWIKYEE